MGLGPAVGHFPWEEKLRRSLHRKCGVRLGESTIVSRQVHVSDPITPHVVMILSGVDAGQAFYSRPNPGEIIHLDIFHAVSDIDHRHVAAALRRALAGVPPAGDTTGSTLVLDFFDLVTGTGGGRVTGDLSYARKASLRAAHKNHVHLAGRLPTEQLHLLLPMVAAVEESVLTQGFEIRRIERIEHSLGTGGSPLDLSPYTDETDSWLRSPVQSGGRTTAASGGGGDGQSLRGRGLSGSDVGEGLSGGNGIPTGEPVVVGGEAETAWDVLETERRMQETLELSRRVGSPDEIKRVLDEVAREQTCGGSNGYGLTSAPYILRQLEEAGLLKRDVRGFKVTDAGRELARFLDQHLRTVKLRFRKLIRRLPSVIPRHGRRPGLSKLPPSPSVRSGPIRGTAPAEAGAWLGDVAVPETVQAALKRTHLGRLGQAEAVASPFTLERRDVHVYLRSGEQPLHVCLLIDASASMAGRRILAAKHLARHLLLSTRDKVAVIAFQEREVKVYVPFTRDYGQVEEGLSRLQPLGLTPLAHGLTRSLELIRDSRVRRPLLLLITDGIPTVPKWTVDPLSDALEAAKLVGAGRIPFGCIGLQPSRRYLEELARVAGGTLHVVEELNEESLVTIANRERQKLSGRTR